MAPRALGALFALVAALAFATAFLGGLAPTAIPGWWDGHPTVQGKEIERKSIHVGLLGAIGCNHGGETTCEPLETGHALDVVGFAELAALGLGFVTALLTAFSVWKLGDRRKFLGKLLLFEVLLVAGGASAVFFHGPDLHVTVQVGMPVGLGFMAVAAGSLLAFIGSLIAMRVEPEPLRLKRSEQRIPTPHQQQPAFDVRELLHDNQQGGMRVTHPHMMPPSPGGPLPGPGPLGGPMGPPPQQQHPINPAPGHQPLFESAPHLRPLYDMQNAGAAPNPVPPQMPTRAPTPVSRDAVGDRLGIPTQMPPPLQEPPTPHYGGDPGYNAGDSASMHAPISPARSIEMTEDIPRESAPELGNLSLAPLDPPRSTSSQYERPSAQYIEAPTTPRRGNDAARRAAAAAMPVPPRPRPSVPPPRPGGPKTSTIAVAVAPMPGVGVAEQSTSVEIDAEAKAAARQERERPSEQSMTRPVERTDESVIAPPPPMPHDTNQTRVPESFEDLETRNANQRFEAGVANTELAPALDEVKPRITTQPFGSQEPGDDESTSLGSKPEPAIAPVVEPAPRVPRRDEPVDHDQPIEPPTYAVRSRAESNGEGPTSHHVPVKAPVMVSDHEAPTNHERKKPLEPKVDTSDETMDVVKVDPPSPPPPQRAALPPPRPSSPPQRATPLPSALRAAKDPPPPNANPPAPTAPSAESGVPSSPFPVAPSAAAFAPPKPLPRPAKPSVPPPAAGSKFPPFVPKPAIPIPSMVPSNGIGKPPSNLEPTATANKSSTTSTTPSPFATIPSPFGPKPTAPAAPSTDEAVTRAARSNAATDPVTAPAGPPERPSEAATRAIPKTEPEPDVVAEPPRAKWRASSESPTSHVASEDFADAAQRDQKAVAAKKAAVDQAVHEERTVQSRGAGRDDLPQNASGEISSKRPGDASTRSSRASGVHESPTAHADVKLPSGPRRATPRAQTPEEVRVISTAPSSLPPPKKVSTTSSGPTPACPQCEAPMTWVEEHLRFYCASCRMYF